MIDPLDPVPPLPRLRPRQRVRVVDVKIRRHLGLIGSLGVIAYQPTAGKPLRFRPDTGPQHTYRIDTSRHPGELIVEPIGP